MTAPDMSYIEDWVAPEVLESAAEAIRSDGAAYQKITDQVETPWRDLYVHFRLWSPQDLAILAAGLKICEHGKAVADGANNTAKHLETCAGLLRPLDRRRQELLAQAAAVRIDLAREPKPDSDSADVSLVEESLRERANEVASAALGLASEYRALMDATAAEIAAIKDDGTKPLPLIGFVVDGGLLMGAVFFPPVSTAAAVVAAGKTIVSVYQSRMTELKEDNPQMSDDEMSSNAAWNTAAVAPAVIAIGITAGAAGGALTGRLTNNPVVVKGVNGVTNLGAGAVASSKGDEYWDHPTPPAQSTGPGSTGPTRPFLDVRPPMTFEGAQAAAQEEAERIRETKDYDRDGYTDKGFRPGEERVLESPNTGYTFTEDPAPPPEKLVLPSFNWGFKQPQDH